LPSSLPGSPGFLLPALLMYHPPDGLMSRPRTHAVPANLNLTAFEAHPSPS
jgi:hypothetical protein